ncbi:Sec1 family domain-containing protein MIP3 [Ananas comosus]|uniref:Sec1 family domain-containing protein MIP3 n=1 Tax=Ananas comosus TaxID=4615 RepID=A0A199W672_ANACO|nr:Sec1 family domain-containing protein MIP3 [Ananas comosus]
MRFASTSSKLDPIPLGGFAEGVLYAKKDYNLAKHPLIDVPNLHVIKLMQSFKSKEYVRETFAWQHYYWYLTNDGIEYLRTYLNLPSEIVPATLKKSAKPPSRPFGSGPPGDRPRPRFGERDGYRGGPRGAPGDFGGDKSGAPPEFQPSFRGSGARPGFGRGSGGFGAGPASSSMEGTLWQIKISKRALLQKRPSPSSSFTKLPLRCFHLLLLREPWEAEEEEEEEEEEEARGEMGSVDLITSSLNSIREISDHIAGAILYVDAGCLEAFQLIGAFPLLLELGARAISSLENLSPLDAIVDWNNSLAEPATKIIAHSALIDSPLGPDAFHEYHSLLLQDYEEIVKRHEKEGLLTHRNSEHIQSPDSQNTKLSSEDNIWSGLDTSYANDPNIEASPSKRNFYADESVSKEDGGARVFVLPSEGTVAESRLSNDNEESLSPGLPAISTGLPFDGEDVPPGAILTAHFLYHLADKMDLKMEIFSLGDTSKIIGKMLTDMSSLYDVSRRSKMSAGLLLIDRTIDLLTPCCHGDSFLDRLLSSLPRRERNSPAQVKSVQSSRDHSPVTVLRPPLDIKIPFDSILSKEGTEKRSDQIHESIIAFISGWNSGQPESDVPELANSNKINSELGSLNGSFLSNYRGASYLEALLDRGAKDGALLIKKWLLEALQNEKLSMNSKARLGITSASELRAMVKKLARDQNSLIRNRGIIQLVLATEIALSEPHSSRWDAFVSAQKILSVSSSDTSQSLSSQIRDFINTSILVRSSQQDKMVGSSEGLLNFQDALLLSTIGYILAGENFPTAVSTGPFSWEEEHALKEAVVEAILERPSSAKLRFLHGLENDLEANSRKDDEKNENAAEKISDDFDDQWGSWDDDETDNQNEQSYGDMQLKLELRDRVDQLFNLKWRNPVLKEGLTALSKLGSDTYSRKGLLYKLLSALLAKYDITGLEYHSSAVGRFFKTGFGRFGLGQAKPSFGDQSVLFIFVVGGINSLEVREAMEAISENSRPDVELILSGTTLLTPDDMFNLMLGSSDSISKAMSLMSGTNLLMLMLPLSPAVAELSLRRDP